MPPRSPLPGETRFGWPRSSGAREALRFVVWLTAVVWFVAPPGVTLAAGLPPVAAALALLGVWIVGFIVLGRLARGLAPLL